MTPQEVTALKLKFYDALVCDPELSAVALRVAWLLLSKYLNSRSLVAWPSAETLAGDLGSSVRQVRRAIEQLTKRRWFEIERGGGRRHSNVYSATFERVTDMSPFPVRAATSAETVTRTVVNGDKNGRETVTYLSPDSPLREPIEETFEGARASAADQAGDVQRPSADYQKDARQGDRGGGNSRAQGHLLLPIKGGNQTPRKQAGAPDWNGWAAWMQTDQGMTKDAAWRWLMAALERIEAERGVDSAEAGAILDRELKRRRKAAA